MKYVVHVGLAILLSQPLIPLFNISALDDGLQTDKVMIPSPLPFTKGNAAISLPFKEKTSASKVNAIRVPYSEWMSIEPRLGSMQGRPRIGCGVNAKMIA